MTALAGLSLGTASALAETRSLTLHNLHNNEDLTVTFKRDGVYDKDGLAQLNYILRDVRDQKVVDMDPHLYDLVWEVYQDTNATQPIQIVCGYRTPDTNAWLRKTSDGVAENSLHMRGQALDFYIPGVNLAQLRAVGLRMQAGGVGFYPTSGSPFVHLDTGSVRHWPLMTRQQLLAVFPDGKTIDIPADGNPLPGYKQALAEYNQRHAELTPPTQVASFTPGAGTPRQGIFGKFIQTVTGNAPVVVTNGTARAPVVVVASAKQPVGVATTTYTTETVVTPLPNLAPRVTQTTVIAAAPAGAGGTALPATTPATSRPQSPRAADFASPDFWVAPTVPMALAAAMVSHEPRQPGSSLPIAPTAVVATVPVSRVLAADAITGAVINGATPAATPTILAFAAEPRPGQAAATPAPVTTAAKPATPAATTPVVPVASAPPLTMTALDTHSLKTWMGSSSTRQRGYALMTMPDFQSTSVIMGASAAATPAKFALTQGSDALRTDRFATAK